MSIIPRKVYYSSILTRYRNGQEMAGDSRIETRQKDNKYALVIKKATKEDAGEIKVEGNFYALYIFLSKLVIYAKCVRLLIIKKKLTQNLCLRRSQL